MKVLIALCATLAVCTARTIITAEGPTDFHMLGKNECTWGPSYWCENIKTAAECNTTKECIKIKWNNMKVPEDNDNVCSVCKDMVQQARDQLESNQTQQDLKAVFEGSCKLIHIKPIVKECVTIVDQFIPELVETLASQMNPSVVCSVAGLCNSAHIDKLLEKYGQPTSKVADIRSLSLEKDEFEPDDCTKCYTVAAHMEYKLNNTPRDQMLLQLLNLCADFSSFTDACSAIIVSHFETIYAHLKENFNSKNICHLSGQCTSKFHKHEESDVSPKVEIRPLSSVGMVDVSDDLPCKLCEQLVGHLRDLLVANTTEVEFQQVLDGLCKQMKSFKNECTSIVDEYYPQIYEYLTKGLNTNAICQMSNLCPAPGKATQTGPIWPLLPQNLKEVVVRMFQNSNKVMKPEKSEKLSELEIQAMQLPIERMMPFPLSEGPIETEGTKSCTLCIYVLHYIQDSLTNPAAEDEVKYVVKNVCKKLPNIIEDDCSEFIDTYGNAIVAILVQEIDPSKVCPMLHVCASESFMKLWKNIPTEYVYDESRNKPSCPLCLLAVSQLYNVIKNNKTEANIEAELDKLCTHLPQSLSQECTDMVKGYSKELIELLIADLTPQEVCVFIKLCKPPNKSILENTFVTDKNGEILTNEIPDVVLPNTNLWKETNNHEIHTAKCTLCKLIVNYIKKEIGFDNISKVKIRQVCKQLPESQIPECINFVEKYGDNIVEIIKYSPDVVCSLVSTTICVI